MSSKNKYIALPGGETCKKVNPNIGSSQSASFLHAAFEDSNPVLSLTEVMPEGEMFDGSEVWQYWDEFWERWVTGAMELFNSYQEFEQSDDLIGRIAIKPIKAIEPVKEVQIYTYEDVASRYADWPTAPLLDAVENKEERVEEEYEKLLADILMIKGPEFWKGFDVALDLLESLGYCKSSMHPYNIVDCTKAKLNRLPKNKIRKTDNTQYIEGIVGKIFASQLAILIANDRYVDELHGCEDHLSDIKQVERIIIKYMASVIKEYNNGK